MAEVDEGLNEREKDLISAHASDHAPVEFDDVRSSQHDMSKRRKPSAHIVDGQPHSLFTQRGEHRRKRHVVIDAIVLRKFQNDPLEWQFLEQFDAALVEESSGREIDR